MLAETNNVAMLVEGAKNFDHDSNIVHFAAAELT